MANFLVIPTRLTRLIVENCIETWKLVPRRKYNYFGDTKKRLISQVTVVLLKDSPCGGSDGKRDCPKKSSSLSSDNPCENNIRKGSVSKDARGPETSTKNQCCENRPRRATINEERCNNKEASSISGLDDPCSRECKLSSTLGCSDSFSMRKTCPEPSSLCPPTDEIARKGRFWRLLTLLGALPTVIISTIIIMKRSREESKKPRPKYVPMDYMYRRTKPFPWGDGNHTLFHNPAKNAVPPHGYEVDDPNEVKKNN